jgi:hypothetical protein
VAVAPTRQSKGEEPAISSRKSLSLKAKGKAVRLPTLRPEHLAARCVDTRRLASWTGPFQGEERQMSTEFVLFRTAGTNEPEPILINPAHVRTVRQSGSAQVTLVMDDGEGGGYQNVEGNLKSVWEKLTGKVSTVEALDEHLTWIRRDPEVE